MPDIKQCPWSQGLPYLCVIDDCDHCQVKELVDRAEAQRWDEDANIADNMRSYWANLNNGSA